MNTDTHNPKVKLMFHYARFGTPEQVLEHPPPNASFQISEHEFEGQPDEHVSGIVHLAGISLLQAVEIIQQYSADTFIILEF